MSEGFEIFRDIFDKDKAARGLKPQIDARTSDLLDRLIEFTESEQKKESKMVSDMSRSVEEASNNAPKGFKRDKRGRRA